MTNLSNLKAMVSNTKKEKVSGIIQAQGMTFHYYRRGNFTLLRRIDPENRQGDFRQKGKVEYNTLLQMIAKEKLQGDPAQAMTERQAREWCHANPIYLGTGDC